MDGLGWSVPCWFFLIFRSLMVYLFGVCSHFMVECFVVQILFFLVPLGFLWFIPISFTDILCPLHCPCVHFWLCFLLFGIFLLFLVCLCLLLFLVVVVVSDDLSWVVVRLLHFSWFCSTLLAS
jgi:hypothetical protein